MSVVDRTVSVRCNGILGKVEGGWHNNRERVEGLQGRGQKRAKGYYAFDTEPKAVSDH